MTAVFLHPSSAGSEAGFSALMMYIVIYMFMNLGAFGVTALVGWETGSDDIEAFNGLSRRPDAFRRREEQRPRPGGHQVRASGDDRTQSCLFQFVIEKEHP